MGIAQMGCSSSLLAGTFVGGGNLGDTYFPTPEAQAYAYFDASMNYRWEVSTPGNVFSIDTLGLDGWKIEGGFGLGYDTIPIGTLTLRDLTISLENETGNLTFDRTVAKNVLWPSEIFIIPILGAGTFTAITFTLNFENFDPNWIGQTNVQSSYAADPGFPDMRNFSSWQAYGPDGQGGTGYLTVVPEPSSGVLLVLGIGGVIALRLCRRSVV